jgi:hypothetical protein
MRSSPTAPPDFSVVALVAAYNEADIIGAVVGDLVEQGVQVYLLDDASTDGTVAAVEPYRGRGLLAVERLAAADGARFEWERILRRKAELARELDARWFIHHDADEFRESPWPGVDLRTGIARVDALGYNAIDFELLNFWPTHDGFRPGDDPRTAFSRFARGDTFDRVQIRCWKKTDMLVDLASSGGHEARFPGRQVFPVRFVLRHYPIRGQAHGERKVFRERQARFLERERARGWHVQYDAAGPGASFLRDPSTLTPCDPAAVELSLVLRHRGVEELDAALAAARGETARLQTELDARTAELDVRAAEAERLRAELDKRTSEVADQQREIEARGTEIGALRRRLDERDATVAGLRSVADDAARRLDAVHRSLSWRWTAPLRAVVRLLRGR